MAKRILIPLQGENIAPRFDLAPEVLIVHMDQGGKLSDRRLVVLARPSPEELCDLVVKERIDILVCCGIEEEFYQFLRWKKVEVFDSVIGSAGAILERLSRGDLRGGAIVWGAE
jgi:predicted Fe-Mo cluster-binding NifX family protein